MKSATSPSFYATTTRVVRYAPSPSSRSCATNLAVIDIDPTWPEWVRRQEFACVFARAPSPAGAVEIAAPCSHARWKVGPGVDHEVFPWEEYREHARPGDYTRSVILRSRS